MSSFNLFGFILSVLFPSICPICKENSDNYHYSPFCLACWSKIERYSGPSCIICGMPTTSENTGRCEDCLKGTSFNKVFYYGKYEGILKEVIHQYKFNRVKRLAKPLAMFLLELPIPDSDAIVVVPLHKKRLRQREFNQTAVIGHHLSKKLKIPLLLDALIKVKETKPQTGLGSEERLRNLNNTFIAKDVVKELNLLLIDDVITTGATIKECSKALLKAGAKSITVLALARSFKDT